MSMVRPVLVVLALFLAAPSLAQTAERTAIPSKGLLWGSKMTIENEPCCTVPKGAKAADPSEATALAAAADRAFREGPILRLKLQGNRTLKITDCDDQDACEADRFRKHRLAAWWPALGYYVVNVGLYEDGMAYLISERDGRTTQLAALPVLSPSGHRAVALQSNLMAGVELDVVDMTADPPKVTEVIDDAGLRRRRPEFVPAAQAGLDRRFERALRGSLAAARRRSQDEAASADRRRHDDVGMLRAGNEEP